MNATAATGYKWRLEVGKSKAERLKERKLKEKRKRLKEKRRKLKG